MTRFVTEFTEALSSSIEPYLDIKVFVDRDRLRPGYRYNAALAQAICESVCMVSIVVPKYFDHEYCLQELATMEKIQNTRTNEIGQNALENRGLVIPVVLRGKIESLPEKMKQHIHCCNFSDFNTSCRKVHKIKPFVREIEKIAEYVSDLYKIFNQYNAVKSFDCGQFAFANKNMMKTWKPKDTTRPSPFFGA
jgi:hypothetical protein